MNSVVTSLGSPCLTTLPASSRIASSAILSMASGQWEAKTMQMFFSLT